MLLKWQIRSEEPSGARVERRRQIYEEKSNSGRLCEMTGGEWTSIQGCCPMASGGAAAARLDDGVPLL